MQFRRRRVITGFEIETDGKTVWVNSNDGMCVGRFSRYGVDVHEDTQTQLLSGHACLDCIHDLPYNQSWDRFLASMEKHYGVKIPPEYKPKEPVNV